MQGSLVRVPDAIEPLIGYRAWVFEVDRYRASLFPLSGRDSSSGSVWDGAHKRWVSAKCASKGVHVPHVIPTGTIAAWVRPVSEPGTCNYCDFHQVPDEGCSCGFYALKTMPSVEASGGGVILGAVVLAGKVIEYTFGYRAERARIVELTPLAGTERDAMRLANRLGLPLTASAAPWTPERLISGV
jgi:hypothetical protein